MIVNLPYGKSQIAVDVPDSAAILKNKNAPKLGDPKSAAIEALRNPIGSPPLRELVQAESKVAIVISDITRPTPNHLIIPWILEELKEVPPKNIAIINGTGTHRENTLEELAGMLGRSVLDQIQVINHSAFNAEELSYLGKSSTGAEVYLNKIYCDADVKIGTGFIEPHFFAGFSGGPKSIMPGVAGIETIMHFHSAALIGDPDSTWGIIEPNPIQQEATEIAMMSHPDFSFNVTLNSDQEITGIYAGNIIAAHRAGAESVREQTMIPCAEPFDIVITTNSGFPLDQNLYQAVKGMSAAHQIVKKGGAIICAAECSEGIPDHGNFKKILQMGDNPQHLLDMINDPDFSMFDQWEVQKMAIIQLWADVYLYSNLNHQQVIDAQLIPADNIETTLTNLIHDHPGTPRIAVLAEGPLTIPYIKATGSAM